MNVFIKRTLFLLTLFIIISDTSYASVVYVSSSSGTDTNDGLSALTPYKTIRKAMEVSKDVRLKAGDIFYETVSLTKASLRRYGEGENPVLCGYKRLKAERWEKVSENIWRLKLIDDCFTGFVVEGSSLSNDIGCLHEYDKDLIHGRKVQHIEELATDWDMWQTERHDKQIPVTEFDWLYLYYSGNPNDLRLEFSVHDTALKLEHSDVDGIDIVGFGFGIAGGPRSTIRNCRMDAIGGRIHLGASSFICYGNGIEFYINRNISDCLVENCIISRCYDCAVTIQGSKSGQAAPKNIIIRNNLIYNCCQAWEDFLRNDDNVVYENCRFENNVVLNSGETSGFGYPKSRFKFCHVLGNNTLGDKGMIIRNNTFVGGNWHCGNSYKGKYRSNVWEGNTCVIKRGDYLLGNYFGTDDVIRIPTEKGEFRSLKAATDDAIRRYRELTGDQTTRFVIKSERNINRRINNIKKQYLQK